MDTQASKKIQSSWFKVASIPVFLTALGTVIINAHLSKYNISDLNILKPKVIFTGFSFAFISVSYLIYLLLFIYTDDIKSNSWWKLVLNSVIKPIIWIPFFYIMFVVDQDTTEYYNWYIFQFPSWRIKAFALAPIFGFFSAISTWDYVIKPRAKIDYVFRWLFILHVIYTLTIGAFCFYLLYKNNQVFIDLTHFFGLITLCTTSLLISWKATQVDIHKGLEIGASYFSKEFKANNYDFAFLFGVSSIVIVILLSSYTRYLYPNLSTKLGGGYLNTSTICTKDFNSHDGKILSVSDSKFFLLDQNENVYIINMGDVEYYFDND